MGRKKPNLFVIGKMKSGTTSLYHYLRYYPEVFTPKQKELYYFSQNLIKDRWKNNPSIASYRLKTEKEYLDYFNEATNEKYLLDDSPLYLYSNEAAKKIYDFNPDAKIIAIFRNPVDYLVSLHSELTYHLLETNENLLSALENEEKRIKEGKSRLLFYKKMCSYTEQLKRFSDAFDNKQIKVLIFKEYVNPNKQTLRDLCDFLDIPFRENIELARINSNKKRRFSAVTKFYRIPIISKIIRKIISQNVFDRLGNYYHKIFTIYTERKNLPKEERKLIKNMLRDEVKNFEKFLKDNGFIDKEFDLMKFWGY